MSDRSASRQGFTLVELLIVIVVIAILAAISIVAYNGVQQRSRDSIRKNDVAQIQRAMSLYKVDKGDLVFSGCGMNSNGQGWYSRQDTLYPRSIHSCLQDAGYVQGLIIDPTGCVSTDGQCSTTAGYMYMSCSSGSYGYIMADLEGVTSAPALPADSVNCPTQSWYSTYGLNYYVRVG